MRRSFFLFVQVVLVLSAFGKVAGVLTWKISSTIRDPLLQFLAPSHLLLLASFLEVVVACYIWYCASDSKRALSVLWLCTLLAVYRIGLWSIGFKGHCRCLGVWGSYTSISEASLDLVAVVLLGFMLVGSLSVLTFPPVQAGSRPFKTQASRDGAVRLNETDERQSG